MKEKITIGLFVDTFYPMIDGVITVVDNYAREMSNYANVIVFAPYIPKGKMDDSIFPYKVVRAKSLPLPKKDYSLPIPQLDTKFLKEVEKHNLDIIHIHSPMAIGKVGIEYAKKHHKVLVGTIHSQYKQDFLRNTKSKVLTNLLTEYIVNLYSKCDCCYTVSEGMAKALYEDYHFPKELKIMRNATNMELIENKEEAKKRITEKYHIKPDEFIFLFVGRLNKLKNIFLIIEALNQIKDQIPYKMLFVGNGEDEEELKKKIKKLHLNEKVVLCGRVENKKLLRDYYASSDLFLFPSMYDTSSIVQVEAASQKCPTLFLKGSVTAAAIKDNVDGFLAENTKEKYAQSIIEIMKNQDIRNQVAENAYKNLYRTWKDEIQKVYENYQELLKEKKDGII